LWTILHNSKQCSTTLSGFSTLKLPHSVQPVTVVSMTQAARHAPQSATTTNVAGCIDNLEHTVTVTVQTNNTSHQHQHAACLGHSLPTGSCHHQSPNRGSRCAGIGTSCGPTLLIASRSQVNSSLSLVRQQQGFLRQTPTPATSAVACWGAQYQAWSILVYIGNMAVKTQ
jgi:hypothetical protein